MVLGGLCWAEFVVLFDCDLAGYVGWWLRLLISYAVSLLVVMDVYTALIVGLWLFWLLLFGFPCFAVCFNSVGLLLF